MIKIDGDYLEGGGQIIRTALSLSAITGKPFELSNVRAKRSKSGLKEQHLQAVNSIAALCNAKHDAELHSQKLVFTPSKLTSGSDLNVNVRTAGSTALILSTILPLAYSLSKPLKVVINGGGTWNMFAPPVLYLQKVILPILKKAGLKADINIKRDGFYPKGGAVVELLLEPWKKQKHIELMEHNIKTTEIYSVASAILRKKKVAERQTEEAVALLGTKLKTNINYVDSICAGSGILIVRSPTLIGASANGEKRKTSERVAQEAVEDIQVEMKGKAGVDHRAADQLMIYMALSGGGKLKTSRISNHTKTNAYVIEMFLPVKFKFEETTIECLPK